MILPDSSAWIEWLRSTGSAADQRFSRAVESGEPMAITGTVLLEILAGARDARELNTARSAFSACHFEVAHEPADYEAAARLYRACRREGTTVRQLSDCLIAAVAIRADATVLHQDSDFDALAHHTPLAVTRG